MEFSENINWSTFDDGVQSSDWCLSQEVFESSSFKISLCERIVTYVKNGITFQEDEDTPADKDATPNIPEPRIPYPRKSDLSIEDQNFFYETYKEYITGKEVVQENVDRLQNLMWTLSSEQDEFSIFLQQHSLLLKDEYNFIQPQVKETILKLLEDQKACVQQHFAPFYTLFQTVGLSTGAVFPSDPILCYTRTLKQAVGQPLLSLTHLEGSERSLLRNREDEDKEHLFFQTELSQDSIACDFSSEHGVHFVLSADALQTLIDNHQPYYDKDWELPITVVDHSNSCNETNPGCLKTVVIDDPLPPKSITPKEMNVMYYQREVCRLLRNSVDRNDEALAQQHTSSNSTNGTNEMQELMGIEDGVKMETKQRNNSQTTNGDLRRLTEKEDHRDEQTTKLEHSFQKPGKHCNSPATESKEPTVASGDVKHLCNSQNDSKDKQNSEKNDFSYSIWTFGNLKLLIRSSECGMLYQSNKGGKGSLHPVNVYVKPEYQLMFGYEKITSSEASRWWMNCYINPDSLCLCARVDPVSSRLLRVDVLSQAAIVKLSSFNPAQSMKMIHSILTRLEKLLEPGKYILSHSSSDMHTCVYERVSDKEGGCEPKKASYDLHACHSRNHEILVNYEKHVPWVPIDPNMLLEWHIAHRRLPMTFTAVSNEELKKLKGMQKKQGKKNKKKNKKRNGKKTREINANEKASENHKFVKDRNVICKNRLRNRNKSMYTDCPVGGLKTGCTDVKTDDGISERLRSKSKPMTYDDIEFDF